MVDKVIFMWYRVFVFSKVLIVVYIKKKRDMKSGYENRNLEMLKMVGICENCL